jgi:hypothetical protein
MRLWSLHPKYLDSKGLVAVWREGLLALAVLRGTTKGYRNHPQLARFKEQRDPIESIRCYLQYIYKESLARGYHFDVARVGGPGVRRMIMVTRGQIKFETSHLRAKLKARAPTQYKALNGIDTVELHPLFTLVDGSIEGWEKGRLQTGG